MKANEFVKKYGWDYAKHILSSDAPFVVGLDYKQLQGLVESHDLVESFGGVEMAKRYLDENHECGDSEVLGHAIADVESCQ